MPLYLKHLLCAITAQGSGPAIRKRPTTLPRMQINPLRSCLYHAGRGLTRLLPISQCLIRLSHHCLPRDSHWRTFMPFTDTRFLVPERRSTIISIRVFLLLKTSIYAARYVTNASQEKLVQGSAWLQKNSV